MLDDLDATRAFCDGLLGREAGRPLFAFPYAATLEPELDPAAQALSS